MGQIRHVMVDGRPDQGPSVQGPSVASAVAVAVGLVVFAVIAAAVSGPWELQDRDFGFSLADRLNELPNLNMGVEDDEPFDHDPPREWNLAWLDVFARIIVGAVAAYVLWRLLRRIRITGRPRRGAGGHDFGDLVDGAEPNLNEMQKGLAIALARLDDAPAPADAIIAAWVALEEAAADAGVERALSHTPTEFTVAILARLDADPTASSMLLGFYHQVRFGHRIPTAADVAAARASLVRIAGEWDAATVRVPREPRP